MNVRTLGLLAILTLAAGYVDAVAFFGFGVFVSNMTGNTVLLGGALVSRLGPHLTGTIGLTMPLLSILCFLVGAWLGALILRAERGRTPVRVVVLLVVALLLAGAAVFHWNRGPSAVAPGIGLLSAAMGMQSIIAARFRIRSVWTTFVTGSLVTAMLDFTGGELASPQRGSEGAENAVSWALYLGGAVGGALALTLMGRDALWPAAVVVALLAPVI